MSELIIGIDLGTTNSCVAIGGHVPGCYQMEGLKGYSIIPDEFSCNFTPSVVYYTGDEENPYEIGDDAKLRVDGSFPPVMFAKRHLGSEKKFQVDDNKYLTPLDVSAEILKFLKAKAEAKLGQKINRAVVTVPAYFDMPQRNLTKKAMELAGFIANDPRYIILEPVAAALTYTQMVENECLNIMVYDLGGGTYDITILKKEHNHVEVVSFGGDPAFGGWNFDRFIADHIVEQLKNKGYKLELNIEKSPSDNMRYTKLLLLAEDVKRELSDKEVHRIRKLSYFKDQDGKPVNIDMKMARKDFETMIRERVNYTMELCRETLGKSGLSVEHIDKIIMVGGSSYIPLIQQRLEEEFKHQPEILEPDLAVAIGAAVHASSLNIPIPGKNKNIELKLNNYPIVTDEKKTSLGGRVNTLSGEPLEDGYVTEVTNPVNMFKDSLKLEKGGAFYFDLKLQENSENTFYLKVINPKGGTDIDKEIKIRHSSDEEEPDPDEGSKISAVKVQLPKTIYIKGEEGLKREFAREGIDLPYEEKKSFSIVKEGHISDNKLLNLDIEIIEENKSLGMLTVKDIPGKDIDSGDPCDVTIKITADNKIIFNAFLPTVNREGTALFKPSVDYIMSKDKLADELKRLDFEWKGLQARISKDKLAEYGIPIERLFTRAREALRGLGADTTEATRMVTDITRVLREIKPVELRPGREEFKKMCEWVRESIKDAESRNDQVKEANLGRSLDAVIADAEDAYQKNDQSKLSAACNQGHALKQRTDAFIHPPQERHVTAEDIRMIISELKQLSDAIKWRLNERKAENHPDYPKWAETLKELESKVEEKRKTISYGDQESLRRDFQDLCNLMEGRLRPLREEVFQEVIITI